MARAWNRRSRRIAVLLSCLIIGFGCSNGKDGQPGADGVDGQDGAPLVADDGTSVEACIQCHGPNGEAPVVDITNAGSSPADVHYVDTHIDGPMAPSGYRQLNVTISEVDVRGTSITIRFSVVDELGLPVDDLFAGDGRFNIAALQPGASLGDATFYQNLINRTENPPSDPANGPGTTPALQGNAEGFSSGTFDSSDAVNGNYVYTSTYNPSGPVRPQDLPVVNGVTHRLAIQLSAGDLPAGNGWCDFVADTVINPNNCVSPVPITRDIVQTATCNGCHGATNDVHLALHGGGRTQVEYCVTCHNPGSTDANSGNTVDLKVMIHKIHYGANLANDYKIWGFGNNLHDYSTVNFTASPDDCTFCHTGGGANEGNWSTVPTMQACGSCHDDVDFAMGVNHVVVANNNDCATCHPQSGAWTPGTSPAPIQTVHRGLARNAEAALYAGGSNGYKIEQLVWDGSNLSIDYSVTRNSVTMDLENDPEWNAPAGASRLAVSVGWSTDEYTNEGSGSTPGLPVGFNAIDIGGVAARVGMTNVFRVVANLPSGAFDTVTATLDGHPAADVTGTGSYDERIPVKNAFLDLNIESRGTTVSRRQVVDAAKCNTCHDLGRQGISLHGANRTGEPQVCVVCHNQDNTDINRRPADPSMAVDGKREESIDFKRMIHRIHTGADGEGIVVYGFGGSPNDFSHVEFIGNRMNCETCHFPGTYGAQNVWANALATTIDTGADVADPSDDLNISPVAAVCSGCHDDDKAKNHMLEQGASFSALDADILQ